MDSPNQSPPLDGASASHADDFSTVKLHRFIGPGLGVVFDAPASWQDASDEALFQVIEPHTETQFTASGYKCHGGQVRFDFEYPVKSYSTCLWRLVAEQYPP